ncbi:uncharacterized protein ACBR49_017743 [Aulostomus maculatus]
MSKKRCKGSDSRSLRAVVEQQLAAAAEQILRLLEERGQAGAEKLKELVAERITAAVEVILTVFEATSAARRGPEEPGQTEGTDSGVIPADVQQLLGSQEEVPPEQQEWSSRVEQEQPEPPLIKDEQQEWSSRVEQEQPEPPHIKEEQEELWTSQEGEQLQGLEEADISKLPFPPVPAIIEIPEDSRATIKKCPQDGSMS